MQILVEMYLLQEMSNFCFLKDIFKILAKTCIKIKAVFMV